MFVYLVGVFSSAVPGADDHVKKSVTILHKLTKVEEAVGAFSSRGLLLHKFSSDTFHTI